MKHTVAINAGFSYKRPMPQSTDKKSEQVLVNLAPTTFSAVAQIAELADRPLGYVVRELMIRGLGLYRRDGLLRDDPFKELQRKVNEKTAVARQRIKLEGEKKRKTG